jgi:PmbA protein
MDYQQFTQDIVAEAMRAGADEAEVFLQTGSEFNAEVRMGEIETLTQASSKGLGIRVFVDKRMGFVSTADFSGEVVSDLVKTAIQLAKVASRDRFNGLPDVGPGPLPHLNLCDPAIEELPADQKIQMAMDAERAALDFDPRITNSHGGGFGSRTGTRILANSNGILYWNSGTDCAVSCAPIAEEGEERQVAAYWTASRFLSELEPPKMVGIEAAKRAVRKLGARRIPTQKAPVVLDWMVADMLWSAVFSALDGDSVHRGMSFLSKSLGKKIASPLVSLIDDPLMPGGLGSMPFDGEGVLTQRKVVIENGVLNLFFYDARTGRKYGRPTSGNARRGYSSLPSVSPTNLFLEPGEFTPEQIIQGVDRGILVTETMGRGINTLTGDFSLGVSGVWIENGELAYPVQEVTIAGNMLDMMANIDQIGDDMRFISSVTSPTFKISEMMISGM